MGAVGLDSLTEKLFPASSGVYMYIYGRCLNEGDADNLELQIIHGNLTPVPRAQESTSIYKALQDILKTTNGLVWFGAFKMFYCNSLILSYTEFDIVTQQNPVGSAVIDFVKSIFPPPSYMRMLITQNCGCTLFPMLTREQLLLHTIIPKIGTVGLVAKKCRQESCGYLKTQKMPFPKRYTPKNARQAPLFSCGMSVPCSCLAVKASSVYPA